jgi:poly(3-hydroxybutyrate) depolymerase
MKRLNSLAVVPIMVCVFGLLACDNPAGSDTPPPAQNPLTEIIPITDVWGSGDAIAAGEVDPDDEAGSIIHGLFSADITMDDSPARKIYLYISPTVRYRQGQVLLAMPSGVDVKDFLWNSGWLEIANRRRMSLLVAEAGEGGWQADESEYMGKAFNFMNTKTYLHTENAAFYLVGYGDAANATMALAVAYQSIWCGVGAFGVDNFNTDFLAVGNTVAPVRGNLNSSFSDGTLLKETPVPMWIGAASKTASVDSLLSYWKTANNASIPGSPNNWAGESWEPPHYLDELWNINEVAVSRVLFTTLTSDEALTHNKEFTNYLWYSFLETQRREDTFKLEAFRPFTHNDDFMDYYTVRAKDNVSDSSLREYWVLESYWAKSHPNVKVPLVIVMHGANQSGADMPHFSGWHLVTEANNIITAYPTGARGTGWKATCSPAIANDIDYFDKMLEKILGDYPNVDPSRIYVSGHSMGCTFATSAALVRPGKIAAVAAASNRPATSVSGTLAGEVDKRKPMPIMISAGEYDFVFGFNQRHNISNIDSQTATAFANAAGNDNASGSWNSRNGVTETSGVPYTNGGRMGNLSGWTFMVGSTNTPVVKFQWVKDRVHAVTPEEAFSLYDFLKDYSRDTATGDSFYKGAKIEIEP